jgi:hypothetical protein
MKPLLTLLLLSLALPAVAQTKKYLIKPGLQATVKHAEGSHIVQVLLPGVDVIELDVSQPPSHSFLIKAADYNFDGYKDFALTSRDPADMMAPTVFDIYLYNPEEQSFEAPENPGGVCGQFSNIRLNAAEKTLRSSCRSGNKSSTDVFRWVTPFSLELASSVDNSADAQQERAEEKADRKADKSDARKEVREERSEKRQQKRDERDEDGE